MAGNLAAAAPRHGVQAFSLIMILVACTGIFLPLEVALNQAWGVTKSRNYLLNQAVAFGLALLMVALALGSILLNAGAARAAGRLFFHHTDNFVFKGISYLWLAVTTGVASILFFFSIYWLLPNRKVPWRPVLRTSSLPESSGWRPSFFLCCAAASGSQGALRAVLRLGGAALLGVCLRTDPVCRRAVQRVAIKPEAGIKRRGGARRKD